MSNLWSLKGKRAVITGGTKGIGRATAETMLDLGASVLVAARDPRGVDETRQQWAGSGRDGEALVADVTTRDGRAELVAAVAARWESLDILVNNVGAGLRKPFTEATEEDVVALVSRNLTAAVHLSRDLLPFLSKGTEPAVVNVGSVAGLVSVRATLLYGAPTLTSTEVDALALEPEGRPAAATSC